jgi:cystathionine beta-lyase
MAKARCKWRNGWARDFIGASGLFGVVMEPAPQSAVDALLDALRLFGLGFSWGGFESLAIYSDPQLKRRKHPPHFAGPLLRFQVGLEAPADLIADLDRGLTAFRRAR